MQKCKKREKGPEAAKELGMEHNQEVPRCVCFANVHNVWCMEKHVVM